MQVFCGTTISKTLVITQARKKKHLHSIQAESCATFFVQCMLFTGSTSIAPERGWSSCPKELTSHVVQYFKGLYGSAGQKLHSISFLFLPQVMDCTSVLQLEEGLQMMFDPPRSCACTLRRWSSCAPSIATSSIMEAIFSEPDNLIDSVLSCNAWDHQLPVNAKVGSFPTVVSSATFSIVAIVAPMKESMLLVIVTFPNVGSFPIPNEEGSTESRLHVAAFPSVISADHLPIIATNSLSNLLTNGKTSCTSEKLAVSKNGLSRITLSFFPIILGLLGMLLLYPQSSGQMFPPPASTQRA